MATSERTKTDSMPVKPLADALPRPTLLWSGTKVTGLGKLPCRLVLVYQWTLPAGAKSWEAVEAVAFEMQFGTHAMGEPNWEQHPLTEIPAIFFAGLIERMAATRSA